MVRAMGIAGWTRYAVPSSAGGILDQMDVRSLCLIRETLARHHALADFAFAMQGLGSGPLSLFGTPEQQQRYLKPVSQGRKIAAFALSELEAGSDVASLATTAREESDGYVLDGVKTWISNGGIADFYTVFARTGEAAGAKGLSCFVVEAGTPGFKVTERIELIAPHPIATLRFDNCRISKDKLFGGTLSDLQLVQGKVADMALDVDASALLVYRSAWTKDCEAERVTREASMAKLYATEAAQRVVDAAVQLHGGHGVVRGNIVESLYRDVRALRIYEGASEVQQTIIARQTLG
jgi:acyl-CoA dehydrogenase